MWDIERQVGIMNYFCKNFPKNRGGCAIILYNTVGRVGSGYFLLSKGGITVDYDLPGVIINDYVWIINTNSDFGCSFHH